MFTSATALRWTRLGLVTLAAGLLLAGCKQDEAPSSELDAESEAAEMSVGQSGMDEVSTFVENEGLQLGTGKTDGGDNAILGPCRNAVRNATLTDSTITFTFNGMTACADGKVRSGTIVVSWDKSKTWREVGKEVRVRSSNYTVNGVTHRFLTIHTLTQGMPQPRWTRVCNDTISVTGRTGTGYWSCNQTRILTTGWSVPVGSRIWDVYGTTTGTSARSISWTSTVSSTVSSEWVRFQPGTCFYPTQGRITVTRSDRQLPRIITFGPGCLNTYQVQVGSFAIRLPF